MAKIKKLTYKHKPIISPASGRMRKLTRQLRRLIGSQLSRKSICSILVNVYQSFFRSILTFSIPITIQTNPSIPVFKYIHKFHCTFQGKRLVNFDKKHETIEYYIVICWDSKNPVHNRITYIFKPRSR